MSTIATPTPALQPPPGVTPDFSHPQSLLKWEILTLCLCLVSTTVVFGLRTYVRVWIKKSFILEDGTPYLIIHQTRADHNIHNSIMYTQLG